MAQIHASWIHGTAVLLEREGYFTSKARAGWGADIRGHGGEWMHFAIPTPVIAAGKRSTVVKVCILYKTLGATKITKVHLYDGVAKFKSFDGLSLSGDHGAQIDGKNSWNVTHVMKYGLGISLYVDFGTPGAGKVSSVHLRTAGADFKTP